MSISLKNPRLENERSGRGPQRKDASFSEIYELIFYNRSLVLPELEVLKHLIEKKLKDRVTAKPDRESGYAHQAYKRQDMIGRILRTE